MAISLIVGLGNPGPTYALTRHNMGIIFIEKLCQSQHTNLSTETKLNARTSKIIINEKMVRVACPTTFMNISG